MLINVELPVTRIRKAFDDIVRAHPTCRARLNGGTKRLEIMDSTSIADMNDIYRFRTSLHGNLDPQQIDEIERDALKSLHVVNGTVFSVDVYRSDHCLWAFLVAQSLLLDEPSWIIILHDLDRALSDRITPATPRHGIWEVVAHASNYANGSDSDTRGSQGRVEPLDMAENRWGLPWKRYSPDISVRSTVYAAYDTAGFESRWKETRDDLTKRALRHILSKFGDAFGPFLGKICWDSHRPLGCERVVGNLEGTPLVFSPAVEDKIRLQQIEQRMQTTVLKLAHDQNSSYGEGAASTHADLFIFVHHQENFGEKSRFDVIGGCRDECP